MRQRATMSSAAHSIRAARIHHAIMVCAFACVFLTANASAQYHIDSWTTSDGLSQKSVNGIIQTRDGFLWLTTFGGLVRYDGITFKVFNPGNTTGIKTSRFLRLFEDRDGNLWVTTENSGVIRYKEGVFTTYTTQDGLPDNFVTEVFHDHNGNLLIDTREALTQWKDGMLVPYTPREGEPFRRPVNRGRLGAIWHYDGVALRRYEGGRQTLEATTPFHISRIFEDSRGRVWLGTREDKLLVFENGKFTNLPVAGVPKVILNRIYEDHQGTLWFALAGYGLLRLMNDKFTRYTVADGLVSNDVNVIYEDREGNLWAGSAGGLNRLTNRVITSYSDADGLSANNIYPIYQDRQGSIWIGSWRGLTVYRDGTFTRVGERYGVSSNLIMSLLEDREGGFWIGTWGEGAKRIKDGKTTSYMPSDNMPLRIVRVIYEDRAGNIWLGSNNSLARYDGHTFTFFTMKDGLSGNTVYAIFEDSRGDLWFGTEAGLTKYSNGAFSSYTEQDGLSGNNVRAIYEDVDGVLWVGTYDAGITRLKDGKFARLTTKEGLFDNGAFHIIEDSQGYFWMSCNRGIYRVSRKNLNELADGKTARLISASYGKEAGGVKVECNGGGQPAGLKARNGKFWFPTQNGVLMIDPEAVPVDTPPPVVIDEFIVGREAVTFHNGVEISPEQESFEIHYVGLSFIKPEQVRFKYKLEGLDADWVDADTRRVAYYTHLPPGRYKFIVVAANTNGVWNTEGASVEIVVVPPFWRTWWFATLIVAGLAAIAISLYRRRIRRLKLAHAAREAFSRKLIESQEKERKRIAAELHDSIGQDLVIIKNWALLGLNVVEESDPSAKQLREISNTAAKAINEVREIAYNLGPYQLDRLGLTRTIEDMVERVSSSSSIRFAADIEQLDGTLSKEAEINLYRVIQEAVSNTVKHSEAREAALTIRRAANHLHVMLRDNGKGFVAESADTYDPRRRGFGLVGIAERIRILGGTWSIHSAFGDGTQIIIQLPLRTHDDNDGGSTNGK